MDVEVACRAGVSTLFLQRHRRENGFDFVHVHVHAGFEIMVHGPSSPSGSWLVYGLGEADSKGPFRYLCSARQCHGMGVQD
jgi:hypothetical protein